MELDALTAAEKELRHKMAEQISQLVTHTEHGDDVRMGPYMGSELADIIAEYCLALLSTLSGGKNG